MENMMMSDSSSEPVAFMWDWKETPPFQGIIDVARQIPNAKAFNIRTGDDQCGLVIGPQSMWQEAAEMFWKQRLEAGEI